MSSINLKIDESWKEALSNVIESPYFKAILDFIEQQRALGKKVLPPSDNILEALKITSFEEVKVIVIGQDPYHGINQAHGLSFSVQPKQKIPPSLKNIYKELNSDLGIDLPTTGYLLPWAEQGVLLLNAVLTVNLGEPASHKKAGWEQFTDRIIMELSQKKEHLVFLLWGKFAQGKRALIDSSKHLILEAPHPSPFSARKGFFGCKHFSKTNSYLKSKGLKEINWEI